MPDGWIILDKPRGLGSTQAVAAVKRAFREGGYGRVKVGHGGTLDPLAEGVLPIALGEATKLAGRMLDSDKAYAFTLSFGAETDTLDAEGAVVATSEHRPTPTEVAAVLPRFTGAIDQVPPSYSALKVGGRRAYDLARAGGEITLASRAVTIHSLHLLRHPRESGDPGPSGACDRLGSRFRGNDEEQVVHTITLVTKVSKGTYIRVLANDIAHALGTRGHVTWLRRLQAGPFHEHQAISLDRLDEIGKGAPLKDYLLPLEAGLDGIPALTLDPDSAQAVRQGRVISGLPHPDGLHLATLDTVPVALVVIAGGSATVERGFNMTHDAAKER